MIEIVKYQPKYKKEWDELIRRSRNGTFLFYRDFLEYHKKKYEECSFLFYHKKKVIAVIAGNISGNIFYSHEYLTIGGFVLDNSVKAVMVMDLFRLLNNELSKIEVAEIVYKSLPYIYHRIPSQEDLYVLFRLNAKRIACDISSTVYNCNKIKFNKTRKNGIRKAQKLGLKVVESDELNAFWAILENNLKNKYKTTPVHSLKEIRYLKEIFPENIKLFVAMTETDILGGAVLFINGNVVHSQYIASTDKGKVSGAIDVLFYELINNICAECEVFDFGKSTEEWGNILNENLIYQKEGFGARGVVYETYSYRVSE